MAMYYYATKLSVVACGIRCRSSVNNYNNKNKNNSKHKITKTNDGADADDADDNYGSKENELTPIKMVYFNNETSVIAGSSSELPEVDVCCENAPQIFEHNAVLGSGGVMYKDGCIYSGPLESFINFLIPQHTEDFDQDFVFSFLLSSRIFIRPHELLGKLLDIVPELEPLDRIVALLAVWTKTFPYDFRDERIMNHVKHIVARCANTTLGDTMSELLSALLNRLTNLEQHEEEMKQYNKPFQSATIQWPSATSLAQILCRIERGYAKHVGPEEFVQCSGNLVKDPNLDKPSTSGSAPGVQDPKKTCNLESYFDWFVRLRLLVSKEILQCQNVCDRNNKVELWSGAAQYCLLVGNYNSATAILESLDSPPIARLQTTWSKLSTTTSQQLNCMQKHAEGYGSLWSKQTTENCGSNFMVNRTSSLRKPKKIQIITPSSSPPTTPVSAPAIPSSTSMPSTSALKKPKSNEWVVLPVFNDIVRLALKAREDCCTRLPNGHINFAAFDRLSAIVGAFTRHMGEVSNVVTTKNEQHDQLIHFMHSCSLLTENELMLLSFECESATKAEKELYDVT